MTNTVLIKRSSAANAVPSAGNLQPGELAINYNDGNLFYKNTSNVVTVIASNQFVSVSGNITGGNVAVTGAVSASSVTSSNSVDFVSAGNISLGNVGNVHILGGTAGYVLSTNGAGNLSWVAQSGGGGGGSTITVDDFTGNGVQTSFPLSVTPPNIESTTVNYNGIIQLRTGYTLSGSNIVFSTPPANGSSIEVTSISVNITGTAAAGSNTQVQFNDAGNFGASANFVFNKTTSTLTTGTVSATGNISGNYILGNGALLTGITAGTSYSNANVADYLASGSDSANIVTTANVTGGNLTTGGIISATGNITGGNISAGNVNLSNLSVSGYVTSNLLPLSNITYNLGSPTLRWKDLWLASSTIYIGNSSITANADSLVLTNPDGGTMAITGASSDLTAVNVTASGNVITGIASVTGAVSAGGNVTGGNLLTGGLISATGNIIGGNILGGANVNATTHTGTTASMSGNVTGGNVLTGGMISATGAVISAANITGGNILTGGLISSTGNVTGGNVNGAGWVTGGNVSTGGNVLVGGYISVVGNLYVANVVSSSNLVVQDPLVYLTANSTYPYNYDIGLYSQFTGAPGNTYQHTGFIRDFEDNTWKLFSNVVPEPTSTIDLANAIYDPLRIGALTATSGAFSTTVSATANVTGGNVLTAGLISATGNISSAGNVSAVYFLGNGSQLTGLPATYGNANVAAYLPTYTGNIAANNVAVTTSLTGNIASLSGNVTGANFITAGIVSATGNVWAGNILGGANVNATTHTGTTASLTGNITGGNVLTGGLISATSTITSAANVTGGNLLTGGLISAASTVTGSSLLGSVVSVTANITSGNLLTGGLVSATGNVTGGNLMTTGSGGNITGANVIFVTTASATANVIAGNVVTAGLISATGTVTSAANITGGNILTGGLISAAANITGSYFIGNGSLLTGISTGNVSRIVNGTSEANIGTSGGNANVTIGGTANVAVFATTGMFVTGLVSVTGNAIGGNIVTAGLVTATGNITGGNIATAGIVSAAGNIVSAVNVTGGNLLTSGIASAASFTGSVVNVTANITGGNLLTGGLISATGNILTAANISGAYLLGNGSQITGITATATPAGANTQIQFNDAGSLGASANLTFNKSTNTLNATTVTANGAPLATTGKAIAMAIVFGF